MLKAIDFRQAGDVCHSISCVKTDDMQDFDAISETC